MGDQSDIGWLRGADGRAGASWNPTTGCSHVSDGCSNCYAETLSLRMGWSKKPWTARNAAENVVLHPERLVQPLRWRRPRRIFVDSMSDLFHEQIPEPYIAAVFAVMATAPQHDFLILTKRSARMQTVMGSASSDPVRWLERGLEYFEGPRMPYVPVSNALLEWPLSQVQLGVSVENQRAADERVPDLMRTPAALRFLSCEPLLAALNLHLTVAAPLWAGDGPGVSARATDRLGLSWVICGGESGQPIGP